MVLLLARHEVLIYSLATPLWDQRLLQFYKVSFVTMAAHQLPKWLSSDCSLAPVHLNNNSVEEDGGGRHLWVWKGPVPPLGPQGPPMT